MTRLILSIAAAVAPAWAAERTVTLAVDNMDCELCPPIVKKSLAHVPGVATADVAAAKGTATVVFDDQKTSVATLVRATTNAGYPSRAIEPDRRPPAPTRPCGIAVRRLSVVPGASLVL